MKKLIDMHQNATNIDVALLVARVGVAALMLTHGLPKLQMLLSADPVQFPSVFGLSASVSLALTVFTEVICSVLLLIGLGTRLFAIPLIITMLVAAFYIHGADPFGKKELAIMYLLPYLVLFFAGGGKYSLDHLLQQKQLEPVYQR